MLELLGIGFHSIPGIGDLVLDPARLQHLSFCAPQIHQLLLHGGVGGAIALNEHSGSPLFPFVPGFSSSTCADGTYMVRSSDANATVSCQACISGATCVDGVLYVSSLYYAAPRSLSLSLRRYR